MLAYERTNGEPECKQQSLADQFSDEIANETLTKDEVESGAVEKDSTTEAVPDEQDTKEETSNKHKAKEHLSKFLDVTRSDMLFADKVILVEGIAEKLLLPLFMEKCGCAYEDEHISIVEIGGKHFEHFVGNRQTICRLAPQGGTAVD